MSGQKRTRRTKAEMEAQRMNTTEPRTTLREGRQEIRQKPGKPLKLDASVIHRELEASKGKKLKLKWVKHEAVSWHQEIGWAVVDSSFRTKVNKYTPDGRLMPKSENIQDDDGGAYTAEVGNGEYNFLMWKDLEAYLAEDAVWNKEEADRPMDSIQSSAEMGARADLGGDVQSYQPKEKVTIEKREHY